MDNSRDAMALMIAHDDGRPLASVEPAIEIDAAVNFHDDSSAMVCISGGTITLEPFAMHPDAFPMAMHFQQQPPNIAMAIIPVGTRNGSMLLANVCEQSFVISERQSFVIICDQ